MPKIPTFISEARPTAEVGSVKSNIQVPLSQTLAGALSPLTDLVVKKAVQEKDITNKTQALKLENEYNIAMQQVTEEIITNPNYGDNQETSQTYYQEQAKKNREKFGSQANNDFTKTMFINNSLLLDQKFSNRLSKDVSKNIVLNLDEQVNIKLNNILTNAFLPSNAEFNREVVIRDLENLYYSSYYGKVPTYLYNKLINNIPNEVYGFEITKGLSSNPRETYTKLLDSKSYPKLDYTLRKEFINKGKLILTGPVKKELENVIFGLKFENREEDPKLDFAKSILKIEEFNEFQTRYNLAKTNFVDVREIFNAPIGDEAAIIERNKYTENDYVGEADLITQSALLEGLQQAAMFKSKAMAADSVGFITSINPEIKKLKDDFINSGTDRNAQIQNRHIYNDAVVAEQIRVGVDTSSLRVTDKGEINQIKSTFLDPSTDSTQKRQFIQTLKALHGPEHIGMVAKHLQDEKAPREMLIALTTNSVALSKDLFSSSSLAELQTLTKTSEVTGETIMKLIGEQTSDYQEVIFKQGEGSKSQAEYMNQVNQAIYKSALIRINSGKTAEEAVESAASDFLSDHRINDEKTMLTPVDVMGTPVAQDASDIKREKIVYMIKNTDVLDTFMGADGYMHYASSLEIKDLSKEDVKKKVTFTIRNHSRWLNNSDMTGAVLYADFFNGLQPVINSDGQRVEYYFTSQPNQDPKIGTTEFVFPHLPNQLLPILPEQDDYGDPAEGYGSDQFGSENLNINNDITSVSEEQFNQQLIEADGMTASSGMIMSNANKNINIQSAGLSSEVADYVSIIKGYESLGKKIIVDGVVKYKNYKGEGEEKITSGYGSYRDENKLEDSVTIAEANAQLVKDINDRLPAIKKNIKNFDKFPLDVRQHLVSSWFRGSLSGSPLTIRLINAGKFKEASIEFLRNEEYDNAISLDRRGIIKRMKNTAKAIKSLSKLNND